MSTGVVKEQVLEALKQVQDPDLHRDIVSLGFIKNLEIDGGNVSFTLELTTPACPVKDKLRDECHDRVKALPGVNKVQVHMSAQVRGTQRSGKALPGVKNVIAVGSGKGGVGKSTCSVNLAVALMQSGAKVGLMDADVYGPSIPTMLGAADFEPEGEGGKVAPLQVHGLKVISMGLLAGSERPLIWRGPIASRAIQQFIHDIDWGDLDYLVIDLPPGTGDIQLTLCQTVPLDGAVIVTTPQDVAVGVTKRGLKMFEQVQVPILGVIENMASFHCPHCRGEIDVFKSGLSRALWEQLGVDRLGSIPLDADLAAGGDKGVPILIGHPDSPVAQAFREAASRIAAALSTLNLGRGQDGVPERVDHSDGNLNIQWKDGRESHYPAADLRLLCPCAVCVDENTGQRRINRDMIPEDICVKGFETTGRYALRLIWSDGHQTGLYNYSFLRNLDVRADAPTAASRA